MTEKSYLEQVRARRSRRRWSRRATTAAWILAAFALLGIWQFFPDLTSSDTTTAADDSTMLERIERIDDLTLDDLDDISLDDVTARRTDVDWAGATVVNDWSLPLPRIDHDRAGRPHHDYPAWDYGVGVGTEVYAMTNGRIASAIDDDEARCGGTVMIRTDSDAQITYCHLSLVVVDRGDEVEAGDLLGLTGGEPGAPGAGNTSGPHLHLQIRFEGQLRCPQDQLLALIDGETLSLGDLNTTGCISGQSRRAGLVGTDDGDRFFVWD